MFFYQKLIDLEAVLAESAEVSSFAEAELKKMAEDNLELEADKIKKIDFSNVDFEKIEKKLLAELGPELLAEIINRGPFHSLRR